MITNSRPVVELRQSLVCLIISSFRPVNLSKQDSGKTTIDQSLYRYLKHACCNSMCYQKWVFRSSRLILTMLLLLILVILSTFYFEEILSLSLKKCQKQSLYVHAKWNPQCTIVVYLLQSCGESISVRIIIIYNCFWYYSKL